MVIAPDTAGGRIKVHIAALQAKPYAGSDHTGSKKSHRAEVVEAIEDASHGIISKSLRGQGLAQKQFGVLVSELLYHLKVVEYSLAGKPDKDNPTTTFEY
jgi:hypothetical protein